MELQHLDRSGRRPACPGLSAVVGFCGTRLMRLPRSRSSSGAIQAVQILALEKDAAALDPAVLAAIAQS